MEQVSATYWELFMAYGFIWLCLAFFLFRILSRQKTFACEIERLEKELLSLEAGRAERRGAKSA